MSAFDGLTLLIKVRAGSFGLKNTSTTLELIMA